jgi:hypothetical protein
MAFLTRFSSTVLSRCGSNRTRTPAPPPLYSTGPENLGSRSTMNASISIGTGSPFEFLRKSPTLSTRRDSRSTSSPMTVRFLWYSSGSSLLKVAVWILIAPRGFLISWASVLAASRA